jgi:CubicO group peptidase (beta-lactamase class C family)
MGRRREAAEMEGETNWLELEDYAEGLREKLNIPGLSIGVLNDGEIRTAGFGTGNVEKGTPVWGETLFQIGSISKTFTAALAMQFVEAGMLDLDAVVRTYLPEFRVADESASAAVTVRNLMAHSGGWDGDLFVETGDGADALPLYVARLADREQLFETGRYFSYNNSGFSVLGAILEKIGGAPVETLYKERIFEPLGLKRAFLNAAEVITEDFAVGHNEGKSGMEVARPWRMPRGTLPMGGIVTDAGNLLRYADCLMRGGESRDGVRVLQAASIVKLWAPRLEIHPADRSSVCLSWMRRELERGYMVSHSGGTNGQVTYLILLPERRFAAAVLTNAEAGRRAIQKIAAFAVERFLGIAVPVPEAIDSDASELSEYAGTAARPGFELHLAMMGAHLVGLATSTVGFPTESEPPDPPEPPFRVGKCGPDRLIVLDGMFEGNPIDVLRDEEGRIRYMRLWSRIYRRLPL